MDTPLDPARERLARLEQQIEALEIRHADDLSDLQRRLEIIVRRRADAMRLLRAEFAALRVSLAGDQLAPIPEYTPAGEGERLAAPREAGEEPEVSPEIVEEAVEQAADNVLHQTISRRELFGRQED